MIIRDISRFEFLIASVCANIFVLSIGATAVLLITPAPAPEINDFNTSTIESMFSFPIGKRNRALSHDFCSGVSFVITCCLFLLRFVKQRFI